MSEWISVKDRLPDSKRFLGFCPDKGIHAFKLHEDSCTTGGWEGCHYCGGESQGVLPGQDEATYHKYEITHWMPLPNPPEVK